LTNITAILLQTILPVLLIAGMGYVLQRQLSLDTRSLSRVCLYVLTPSLGFSSIAQSQMSTDELWRMASVSVLTVAAMVVIGQVTAGLCGLDRSRRSALQLTLAFSNCGNFGLSVCLLAFGDIGLERAIIYYITSALLANSLGVYLASRGGEAGTVRKSLRNTLTMPLLYAAVLGLAFNLSGWSVPEPLMKAIELAGRAAVPLMLLVLGMQLARSRLGNDLRILSLGSALRLIVGPALGLAFATLLALRQVSWQVAILESAMPTAVTTVILSEEFGASTDLASGMVLITTLLSVITLTGLLALIS
jgi:malate permease and related proteins